ncbi:hypothetical protein EJB05_36172, partial [Eragrostis curvula]
MYHRSCSLRYEVYPFFDAKAVEVAMSPTPTPGARPVNGGDLPNPGSTGSTHTGTFAKKGSTRTVRTAILVSVPVAVTVLVLLFVAIYICNRKRHKHLSFSHVASNGHESEEIVSLESLQYDLSTLRAATDNFSEQNRLGQDAFGLVYKGKLQNGQGIAVKRLSKTSQQGAVEMKNEVVLVAKLQHKNLVWKHWSEGNVLPLLDSCPAEDHGKQEEMLRCIHIGLICVQDKAQLWPHMADVVLMLKEPLHDAGFAHRAHLRSPEQEADGGSLGAINQRSLHLSIGATLMGPQDGPSWCCFVFEFLLIYQKQE